MASLLVVKGAVVWPEPEFERDELAGSIAVLVTEDVLEVFVEDDAGDVGGPAEPLGAGTSTWIFGAVPSGCGMTTIGPTCTGPTVIGASRPSGAVAVAVGAVASGLSIELEVAVGPAGEAVEPTAGTCGERVVASAGGRIGTNEEEARSRLGRAVSADEGAACWPRERLGGVALDVESELGRAALDVVAALEPPPAGVGSAEGDASLALVGGAERAGAGAAVAADGVEYGLGGVGPAGAPGVADSLVERLDVAVSGAGERRSLSEAVFDGLDQAGGSASWVEFPLLASAATPATPTTARTTVAATTTRNGDTTRPPRPRGFAEDDCGPGPKPKRSSGVPPRRGSDPAGGLSPEPDPNGSLTPSPLRRYPRRLLTGTSLGVCDACGVRPVRAAVWFP